MSAPLTALRIGHGFDVHAFAPGRRLVLGGVEIPCERGLLGHSDADVVAHALAAIKNRKFGGQVNAERIALLAMYHDASEVLTGDLPTPVKYFNSQIAQEYKAIEKIAQQKLVDMVPDELRDIFAPLIDEHALSEEERSIVKQADALCAYLKCLEELSAGNNEFLLAKTRLEKTLESRRSEEMDYFMDVFVPSFHLSLDEISQDSPL